MEGVSEVTPVKVAAAAEAEPRVLGVLLCDGVAVPLGKELRVEREEAEGHEVGEGVEDTAALVESVAEARGLGEDEGVAATRGEGVSKLLPDAIAVLDAEKVALRLPPPPSAAEALGGALGQALWEALYVGVAEAVLHGVVWRELEGVAEVVELTEEKGEALSSLGLAPPEGEVEAVEEEELEAAVEPLLLKLCEELLDCRAEALVEGVARAESEGPREGVEGREGVAEPLPPSALCVPCAVTLAEAEGRDEADLLGVEEAELLGEAEAGALWVS